MICALHDHRDHIASNARCGNGRVQHRDSGIGASRPKMGNIASPWRYEGTARWANFRLRRALRDILLAEAAGNNRVGVVTSVLASPGNMLIGPHEQLRRPIDVLEAGLIDAYNFERHSTAHRSRHQFGIRGCSKRDKREPGAQPIE